MMCDDDIPEAFDTRSCPYPTPYTVEDALREEIERLEGEVQRRYPQGRRLIDLDDLEEWVRSLRIVTTTTADATDVKAALADCEVHNLDEALIDEVINAVNAASNDHVTVTTPDGTTYSDDTVEGALVRALAVEGLIGDLRADR